MTRADRLDLDRSAASPTPMPDAVSKSSPPGLSLRAPRPQAVRLRKSVVQTVVIGGIVLVSGSLAWAFVVQPELRQAAGRRTEAPSQEAGARTVRPADVVVGQPSRYDQLPPPRLTPLATKPQSLDPEPIPVSSGHAIRGASPQGGASDNARASASARLQAVGSSLFFAETQKGVRPQIPEAPMQALIAGKASQDGAYNSHRLTAPLSPYELKAGAMVPAALLTAVDTARTGPVVAIVTQNVFDSVSGRHLLIPQGTRLIGKSDGRSAYGDRRAFISWERLLLPNGKSLLLGEEAGVDAQGAIGVRGQVDRRLVPLAVGTLFAGAITALGQSARNGERGGHGLFADAGDAAAIEAAQVGGRLIDRELEVRPSIRLTAGAPVRVLITRDLVLELYEP